MSDESSEPDVVPRQQGPKIWQIVFLAIVAVIAVSATVIGNNFFGQNIHGKVYCGSGSNVAGVFVEAERLPRLWDINVGPKWLRQGPPIQSRFANNRWRGAESNSAEFDFWLPLGGRYAIHFGCGVLATGGWATNNQTPYMTGTNHSWSCRDPRSDGPVVVIVRDCRRVD